MLAIVVQTGTKYACNENNNGDIIWIRSQFQRRQSMLAISSTKRTIYNCNPIQKGPNMLVITEIVLEARARL